MAPKKRKAEEQSDGADGAQASQVRAAVLHRCPGRAAVPTCPGGSPELSLEKAAKSCSMQPQSCDCASTSAQAPPPAAARALSASSSAVAPLSVTLKASDGRGGTEYLKADPYLLARASPVRAGCLCRRARAGLLERNRAPLRAGDWLRRPPGPLRAAQVLEGKFYRDKAGSKLGMGLKVFP